MAEILEKKKKRTERLRETEGDSEGLQTRDSVILALSCPFSVVCLFLPSSPNDRPTPPPGSVSGRPFHWDAGDYPNLPLRPSGQSRLSAWYESILPSSVPCLTLEPAP